MRVGIVGAGITGLALAHHLTEREVDAVVLEAADRPGGVIRSIERDGRVLELGPQRIRLTPGIAELVEAVGLDDEVVEADPDLPLYCYADGELGLAPTSRDAWLRTDLLSWRGKLRMLAEPLTRAGDPTETIGECFRRKFGEEAYRNFVGPLYGGIYGSDPDAMPARYALAGLLEREKEAGSMLSALREQFAGSQGSAPASLEGGLQALPAALATTHDDRVHLGRPATGVRTADGEYALDTPDGEEVVDEVVLTTPADVTAELLAEVEPAAARLDELTYNRLAVVALLAETDRRGMGYQVGYGEDLRTLGVSWLDSLFDRDGLYTAFLGGMHDPEVLAEPSETIGEVARREFETVMDCSARVLHVEVLDRGFPAYDRSWDALEGFEPPEGIHLATNYTDRMGVPSRVRQAKQLAETLARRSDES